MDFRTILYGCDYQDINVKIDSDSNLDSNRLDIFEPKSTPPLSYILPQDTGPSWIPYARAQSLEHIPLETSTLSHEPSATPGDKKPKQSTYFHSTGARIMALTLKGYDWPIPKITAITGIKTTAIFDLVVKASSRG
jgi:hypothetical protein